jgi:uncharacterized protein (TIGR02996 family)
MSAPRLPEDAEPAAVLAAAIAAWGELRHPRLADLVDRIEAQLLAAAPRRPLRASKRREDLAAWRTVEAARDPLDVRRLGAALGGGSQDDVRRQVEALAARRDPRLARALLALLEQPPYAGVKSRGMLAAILERLAETRDVRAAGPAADLADRYLGIVHSGTGRWMVGELKAVARRLEAAVPAELPPELAVACAALEARFGRPAVDGTLAATRRTLEELLAEVYAAPDDDGPRLVYADALLERGDPRGELVALQIARARGEVTEEARAREAELLADKAQVAAWAQPLSSGGECTFERGFPAEIALYRTAKSILGEPAWATITAIRAIAQVPQTVAAQICELPHLRSVATLSVPFFERLCEQPRPWTHAGIDGAEPPSAKAFANLPALRSLALAAGDVPPDDLLASLDLRELVLRLGAGTRPLALPPRLERLHVTSRGRLPVMDLARLDRLEELQVEYEHSDQVFALPASLRRLSLRSGAAASPRIEVVAATTGADVAATTGADVAATTGADVAATTGADVAATTGADVQPSSLRYAALNVRVLAADVLRDLTSLEALDLWATGGVPAGALDGLVRLRRLGLHVANALEPDALVRLVRLEELDVSTRETARPRLAGLPIRSLTWLQLPLDQVPEGLPLARARLAMPRSLDDLERFVASYPALARLELVVDFSHTLETRDAALWRRFAAILEASGIGRFTLDLRGWETLTLSRDEDGALSRLTLSRGDLPAGEALARALTRVTAIESKGSKVPSRIAKLVR